MDELVTDADLEVVDEAPLDSATIAGLAAGHDIVHVDHYDVSPDLLRVLTARHLGLPPSHGALFQLGTGTLCRLGTEHGRPVIAARNVRPPS